MDQCGLCGITDTYSHRCGNTHRAAENALSAVQSGWRSTQITARNTIDAVLASMVGKRGRCKVVNDEWHPGSQCKRGYFTATLYVRGDVQKFLNVTLPRLRAQWARKAEIRAKAKRVAEKRAKKLDAKLRRFCARLGIRVADQIQMVDRLIGEIVTSPEGRPQQAIRLSSTGYMVRDDRGYFYVSSWRESLPLALRSLLPRERRINPELPWTRQGEFHFAPMIVQPEHSILIPYAVLLPLSSGSRHVASGQVWIDQRTADVVGLKAGSIVSAPDHDRYTAPYPVVVYSTTGASD